VVGIAVNVLVFPPLHLNAAAASLADLRQALGKQLTDMGSALKEKWPPEHEEWSRRSDELAEAAKSVRHLVKEADASRRANPRRKLHPRDMDKDYRDLRDLERVTFHIQDMTDVLSDVIWKDDVPYAIPLEDNDLLADAITATGELLCIEGEDDEQARKDAHESARTAVEACMATTAGRQAEQGTVPASESVLLSLHRILRAVRPAD
ncbi:MAG: FUSC family protein, partial [Actinomycetes bacterium]